MYTAPYGTFYSTSIESPPEHRLPYRYGHLPTTYSSGTCPAMSFARKLSSIGSASKQSPPSSHKYIPPTDDDVRSVCPALNTMANHGYIPRDGRNLTFLTIYRALKECYGLSTPLAIVLTLGGFLLIGRLPICLPFTVPYMFAARNPDGSRSQPGVIDLKLVGRHGRVEHNASLVHEDCPPGWIYPSIKIRHHWVKKLVGDVLPPVRGYGDAADEEEDDSFMHAWKQFTTRAYMSTLVSEADVGRMRERRERECEGKEMTDFHREIARGRMAIILGVWETSEELEDGKVKKGIPLPYLLTWLGEERLPEGWKPDHVQGLLDVNRRKKAIQRTAEAIAPAQM
ncbi:hypothetical protein PQX77_011855 [Marasmius sp. AFHP31]|nr:hypothetical protein PQX77_011855 [Marasmius sp. AFHP31]